MNAESELYYWLSKNNIDILIENNVIESVMKQIMAGFIEPTEELMIILDKIYLSKQN